MPDGSGVIWWLDPLGDERGHWVLTPFDGSDPSPLLPGVADGWAMGLSVVPGAIAAGDGAGHDRESHSHRPPRRGARARDRSRRTV